MFSDGLCGGKQKALRKAIRFRNQHASPHNIQRKRTRPFFHVMAWSSKKTKLPVGVTRVGYWKKQVKNGHVYTYWYDYVAAYYNYNNKQIRKSWNLSTHSMRSALDEAVAFRRKGLKRITSNGVTHARP